jgi:hypothetical protein
MTRLSRIGSGVLLLGLVSACTSTHATASGSHPSATASLTATVPAPSASPSAEPLPPLPSAGFSGPGAFTVTWSGTTFVNTVCPATDPTATCYAGTATANLPILGRVVLSRTVAAGDGILAAPSGCVDAITDGTITGPTGAITFHATGLLCGRTSTYAVTSSKGAGSMGGYALDAQIVNDPTAEKWSGQIAPSS